MGGPGMGGPSSSGDDAKKDGVAEAAPKTPGLLPTTPALPPQKSRRKKWKLLELDGYFRVRTDWFKNFNLGFSDDPALGGAPFPRPLHCQTTITDCDSSPSVSGANMRLRLEPTINLNEGTSIHIQADVYDNLILGSTPAIGDFSQFTDTNLPPVGAFNNNQQAPERGVNSDRSAIIIKRAWAEIAVPLGIIKVGRMPNQWGMGIFANGGAYDPINGTYDYESDLGDNVDRASFSALIPGTNLRAMIASDWVLTRLVSNQADLGVGRENHPWNLDSKDDASAWVAVISRLDSPQEFRDRVDRGETAFNYGVYFEYKTQEFDDNLTGFKLGGAFDAPSKYVVRNLKTYTPDLWAKLGVGRFLFEAEVVGQFGSVRLDDYGLTGQIDIRKFGGTGRLTWRGLDGRLRLGFESGFASGGQFDNKIPGRTFITNADLTGPPTNKELTQFFFNREYKIDLILFRHLLGSVTNAVYAKPFLSYDLTKSIQFRVANVTSFALKPVATPGNEPFYGTEFDGDLSYNTGNLSLGIAYGVLFPFGAMRHPADENGGTFGFTGTGVSNVGDPGTAHTIQSRLILRF
ncbi:MAG: TIGR04551 family protein [Deltaproteobacteria bacterium]|nr:TIGR04551 family protein [Deltaproteobacteria bacterium]